MMQKGFSLPEITVALGLVAGISLVTMKLVENNARNQNSLKASGEIQKTISLLKASLNDPDRCRTIMRGQRVAIGVASTAPGQLIGTNAGAGAVGLFQQVRTGEYKELLRPNTSYPGFRTTDITLRRVAGAPNDTAELIVNFANKIDSNMRNEANITMADKGTRIVIPLVVKLDASNDVTDCFPKVSDVDEAARQKFCLSLGNLANWDTTTRTCKFTTHQCDYGFVPSVFQSTGALTCVPLKDQMNPDLLFDQTPCNLNTGNLRIIEVGGKLKLECN